MFTIRLVLSRIDRNSLGIDAGNAATRRAGDQLFVVQQSADHIIASGSLLLLVLGLASLWLSRDCCVNAASIHRQRRS
jgi:hypothetical protein